MAQEFDTGDDAILAKREPADAVIASRAQWPGALIALHGGGIPGVISAVH
jgi:hypothetical protein